MRRGLPSLSLEATEAAPLGGAASVSKLAKLALRSLGYGTGQTGDAVSGLPRAELVARPLRPLRGVRGSGIASG